MSIFNFSKISYGLIKDTNAQANKIKNKEKKEIEETINKEKKPQLKYKDIIQVDFPNNLFFKEQTKKKQIVLHHTVSGKNVSGVINWWKQNPQRIATAILVAHNGDIHQLFSSKYWAHHLGIRSSNNRTLNKKSIGIEIVSWGGLIKYNRKWYPALWDSKLKKNMPNTRVKPIENVQTYLNGYRGFYGFEKYTDEQIESIRKLLVYWNNTHKIPLVYNDEMFDISERALSGEEGIWSHTSFRADKSDIHPQPELIQMLKSLKQ